MIPLAIPNLSGQEAEFLQECIATGFVSSVGPFVTRMEAMTAEACGAKHAVATSAGTTALHLALTCAGTVPGDLVIAPAFTFIGTANAIAHCGATPWLLDIDEESWTLSAVALATALSRDTHRANGQLIHTPTGRRVAAVMPVHTLGTPAEMDTLRALCDRYELPVVADAAAALGAEYRGRPIGGLADLSVVSFNGNKTVTAGGGGMVVGNDDVLVKRARHLSSTARVGTDYHHDAVGFNYRMTNLQAAVGCAQLAQLGDFVQRKRDIRRRYDETLAGLPGVSAFPQPTWAQSSCWLSGLVLERQEPSTVATALRKLQIEARPFWKPIHLQPPYVTAPRDGLAVTESVWSRIVTLPCSTSLTDAEQDEVISAVSSSLRASTP